jgi:hypothetical protein
MSFDVHRKDVGRREFPQNSHGGQLRVERQPTTHSVAASRSRQKRNLELSRGRFRQSLRHAAQQTFAQKNTFATNHLAAIVQTKDWQQDHRYEDKRSNRFEQAILAEGVSNTSPFAGVRWCSQGPEKSPFLLA